MKHPPQILLYLGMGYSECGFFASAKTAVSRWFHRVHCKFATDALQSETSLSSAVTESGQFASRRGAAREPFRALRALSEVGEAPSCRASIPKFRPRQAGAIP